MGAAIGWLQRSSSPSEEGRASWPGLRGELEPLFGRSGSRPKNSIAAAYGGAVAFRGVAWPLVLSGCFLGARRVPDAFWTVRRPDAC